MIKGVRKLVFFYSLERLWSYGLNIHYLICLSLSNVFNRKKAALFLCNHVVYVWRKDWHYVFSLKFQSSYYILIGISLFSKYFLERSLHNAGRDVYIEAVNTYNALDHLYVVELHEIYVKI